MASDPGNGDPSDPDDTDDGGDVDREELRTMIREELRGVLDEFDFPGAGDAASGEGTDPAPGKPLTLRDIEAASFNGTRKAMSELQRKPRKKPAASEKPPPEPPPSDPPRGFVERAREVLWG